MNEYLDKIYKEDDAALTYRAYGEYVPIICVTDCNSLFNELQTSNTIEDKGLRIPIGGLRRKLKDNVGGTQVGGKRKTTG